MRVLRIIRDKRKSYLERKAQKNLIVNGPNALMSLINIADSIKAEFYPFHGTLLGIYRECNFIKYDDDIDITMSVKYLSPKLLEALKAGGAVLDHLSFSSDYRGCILSMLFHDIITEIYFYYISGEKQYIYMPCTLNHDWAYYRRINMYPFKEVETPKAEGFVYHKFRDTQIKIPENTDKILTTLYGPDYMTPIRKKKGGNLVPVAYPMLEKRWHTLPIEMVTDELMAVIRGE